MSDDFRTRSAMRESETPRTDAEAFDTPAADARIHSGGAFVPAALARELELQLAASDRRCGEAYANGWHDCAEEKTLPSQSSDRERRAAEYITSIQDAMGSGDDPVGFLIASHAALRERNNIEGPQAVVVPVSNAGPEANTGGLRSSTRAISRDRIEKLLKEYRCQHTQDDSGGSHLVDVLTPPDEESITLGKDEIYLLADYLAAELRSVDSATPFGEHWVTEAARMTRPAVLGMDAGSKACGPNSTRGHLLYMLEGIEAGMMSPTKACRWLGWVQACLYCNGVLPLEDAKAINKAASDKHARTDRTIRKEK